MVAGSPLDEWRFLIGTWKSSAKDQFSEKGVVEGVAVFSYEPREAFIMAKGENSCEGRLLNKSVSILSMTVPRSSDVRRSFLMGLLIMKWNVQGARMR
jgi:hypothetical protein